MRRILAYHVPESVEQAVSLINSIPNARILAGGSGVNRESTGEFTLVDLKGCGLDFIESSGGPVRIGAMTTISKILESTASGLLGSCFHQALRTTGHAVVRNQITIGGSIASMHPWFNLAAPLLLLNAELKITSKEGEEKVLFQDYIEKGRDYIRNRIITEVIIPAPMEGRQAFGRLTMTEVDYAPVFAACCLTEEGGTIKEARIAVSGCLAKPRIVEAGKCLVGSSLTEPLALEAGKKAASELAGSIISANPNFSPSYVEKVLPAVVAGTILGGHDEDHH